MTDTIQVGPNPTATTVVYAGSRPALINNNGPATVFFGDNNAIRATDASGIVAVTSGGYISVDGMEDFFACVASGQTAQLNVITGGQTFFAPTNLSLLGGAAVFVQATAPVNNPANPIPLNSLWLNTTLGALEVWNGTTWVIQTFTGSEIIAAGTIIANLIAAGVVVAGIVNGTVIQGAQLLAGTSPNTQISISGIGGVGIIDFMTNNPAFADGSIFSVASPFAQNQWTGPASTAVGFTDRVRDQWNSSDGVASAANRQLIYVDTTGTQHFYLNLSAGGVGIIAGSIAGVHPGTGSIATPATPEGWQTPTLVNGWVSAGKVPGGVRYMMTPFFGGAMYIEADVNNPTIGVPSAASTIAVVDTPYITAFNGIQRNLAAMTNQRVANNSASGSWGWYDGAGNIQVINYQISNVEVAFAGFVPIT